MAGFIPASQGSHYRSVAPLSRRSTRLTPLKIRGVREVMSKYSGGAVKMGAIQIKLDARLLGDRWIEVLEDVLRSDCP